MRIALLSLFCVATLASFLAAQKPSASEELWRRCSGCHGMPDERVPGDSLWLGRIAVTRCIQPPAPENNGERQSLVAWLKAAARERPALVSEPASQEAPGGRVEVAFADGSLLFLPESSGQADTRTPQRLVFERRKPGARALPAGRWRLAGYRLQRLDKEQTLWQLWGAGKAERVLDIKAGEVTKLALDERAGVRVQWSIKGEKFQGGLAVTGDAGLGATLMAGKERVPARMVLRAGATTLDSVPLDWG